jgi:thymidylate kinase
MTRAHHPTVIHVEGMDLAGKSTVTRSLQEAIPAPSSGATP